VKEEIIEGDTGFVFRPKDSADLAAKINKYFQSEVFLNLETRRSEIKVYANEGYSWNRVASRTISVYSQV
jgi:glycosyltransferase involved in cell wall biosynthesis